MGCSTDDMAEEIETARRAAVCIAPFSGRCPDLTLDAAYEVAQRASAQRRQITGSVTVGRKIGFTNRTIWDRYGVHAPIWGWMYDDTVRLTETDNHPGPPEAVVDVSALSQPRIEPEIVFGLAAPVLAGDSVDTIARRVAWVAFGFEVVHCHYPDWRFSIADTVIDGSLHGASRVGRRVPPWPGMVEHLETFTLRLRRNGDVLGEGRGSHVLDSPLHAVAHLAGVTGRLEAGEILTTGTITDAAPGRPGDTFDVEIDGLPLEGLSLRLV